MPVIQCTTHTKFEDETCRTAEVFQQCFLEALVTTLWKLNKSPDVEFIAMVRWPGHDGLCVNLWVALATATYSPVRATIQGCHSTCGVALLHATKRMKNRCADEK